MAGVNKAIIIGRLGADPEVKFTGSGTAVATLSVATSEKWTDKSGERQERTEWHRIVLWGKLAELAGEYLSKGRQVYIEGSLQTRKWTDKQGNDRYTTEIVGRQMTFLGGGGEGGGGKGESQRGGGRARGDSGHSYGPPPMGDDDVPF